MSQTTPKKAARKTVRHVIENPPFSQAGDSEALPDSPYAEWLKQREASRLIGVEMHELDIKITALYAELLLDDEFRLPNKPAPK